MTTKVISHCFKQQIFIPTEPLLHFGTTSRMIKEETSFIDIDKEQTRTVTNAKSNKISFK